MEKNRKANRDRRSYRSSIPNAEIRMPGILYAEVLPRRRIANQTAQLKEVWTLLGSNQRPYACEAYALNQLS
jgi:hypothetical protein